MMRDYIRDLRKRFAFCMALYFLFFVFLIFFIVAIDNRVPFAQAFITFLLSVSCIGLTPFALISYIRLRRLKGIYLSVTRDKIYSLEQLAANTGKSVSAVKSRITRLKNLGYLPGYTFDEKTGIIAPPAENINKATAAGTDPIAHVMNNPQSA